jgi:hypothetical protein
VGAVRARPMTDSPSSGSGSGSPPPGPQAVAQLKKALIEAGFEVFRTRGEEIVLAERPRENLILDSGVRVRMGTPLQIRFVVRAQQADFPNDGETSLFDRARGAAARAVAAGFAEVEATTTRVADPGDASRTLDTFYEVIFAKAAATVADAVVEVRFVLGLEKRA